MSDCTIEARKVREAPCVTRSGRNQQVLVFLFVRVSAQNLCAGLLMEGPSWWVAEDATRLETGEERSSSLPKTPLNGLQRH
jgi:hypothetical protein